MDKNKIIEAAAKLVAKGAYDKAIKEYQRVLEADPKDVRILQKMGELYVKKNDNVQAAHFFTKVAESYAGDGFFLKAVALYKQVLKLNPALMEVNLKLAELHQQLQLMGEAMTYYQVVANHYDKSGDTRRSLDTLRKMVDLDPDNVASRVKLAELYARESMNKEAVAEFKRAAEYLQRNNRDDDYLRVAERISSLEPGNVELARELAERYLAVGDQKRALAKLQICFKADPHDLGTLRLLANAFRALGQTSKTLSVYKELARLHEEQGDRDEANRVWAEVEQVDPRDQDLLARKSASQPKAAPKAAAAPPPPPSSPSLPPRPTSAPPISAAPTQVGAPLSREQLVKLLTETDVYVKYGLYDKALEHLRKVFAAEPENLDAHEKAYNIYVAAGNDAQAGDQLLNVLRLCTRRVEVARAQPYLAALQQRSPSHPELPAFVQVLGGRGGASASEEIELEPVRDDEILVDSNDEELVVAEAPEDALAVDDVALHTAHLPEVDEVLPDEEAQIVSEPELDDEPLDSSPGTEIEFDEPLGTPPPSIDDEVIEEVGSELVVADEELDAGQDDGTPVYELNAGDEGEEVVSTQLHGLPEEEPEPPPPAPVERPAGKPHLRAVQSPPPEEEAVEAPPDEEPGAEECDEAAFFLDQGLLEEAREILETLLIAYPGHARATELMERLESAPPPLETGVADTGNQDAFDLAAELAGELSSAPPEVAPSAAGDDFQYSVEEVFSEFKKGLEKVVKPEDVDTHYDLGIAYKEMGLVDDAIGEFAVARKGCLGKPKEVDCLTMTGLLHMAKGDAASAVDVFREALASPHATGEAEKGLRYELGEAHQAAGSKGKALFQFLKVQKLDPKYRDVQAHVSALAAEVKPEDDAPAERGSGKARKVGYL